MNTFMFIAGMFNYIINNLKQVFKPDADLRLKYYYNPETKMMENKVGGILHTFSMSDEFSLFMVYENLKKTVELQYVEYKDLKIFYGFPIIVNEDCKMLITSYDDDLYLDLKKGKIIPYEKIFR